MIPLLFTAIKILIFFWHKCYAQQILLAVSSQAASSFEIVTRTDSDSQAVKQKEGTFLAQRGKEEVLAEI